MKLESSAFEHMGLIPRKYTCQGIEVNPDIKIIDAPSSTKSFVLIMEDPDVPTHLRSDGLWIHWILYNLPVLDLIEEGNKLGICGRNTSGSNVYVGPCPPDREHRYFFTLYALREETNLPEGLTKEEVLKHIEGKILEKAELIGRYEQS